MPKYTDSEIVAWLEESAFALTAHVVLVKPGTTGCVFAEKWSYSTGPRSFRAWVERQMDADLTTKPRRESRQSQHVGSCGSSTDQ